MKFNPNLLRNANTQFSRVGVKNEKKIRSFSDFFFVKLGLYKGHA